jgi:hypothetical protein
MRLRKVWDECGDVSEFQNKECRQDAERAIVEDAALYDWEGKLSCPDFET